MTSFLRPFIALIAIIILVSCSGKKQAEAGKTGASETSAQTASTPQQIEKIAPVFILENAAGVKQSLADYKGKVIVLNFWATWCPPCRREIPDFIELQKQYGSQGLQIVGIAVDQEGWSVVKPFISQNGINYPIFMSTEETYETYQQFLPADQQGAIPFTFIIGKNGAIQKHIVGSADKATFEGLIKPLLEG
jgi:cytochrome c biogenesis protein CcmG/thiol:disulfide interchange protein DsbE